MCEIFSMSILFATADWLADGWGMGDRRDLSAKELAAKIPPRGGLSVQLIVVLPIEKRSMKQSINNSHMTDGNRRRCYETWCAAPRRASTAALVPLRRPCTHLRWAPPPWNRGRGTLEFLPLHTFYFGSKWANMYSPKMGREKEKAGERKKKSWKIFTDKKILWETH